MKLIFFFKVVLKIQKMCRVLHVDLAVSGHSDLMQFLSNVQIYVYVF